MFNIMFSNTMASFIKGLVIVFPVLLQSHQDERQQNYLSETGNQLSTAAVNTPVEKSSFNTEVVTGIKAEHRLVEKQLSHLFSQKNISGEPETSSDWMFNGDRIGSSYLSWDYTFPGDINGDGFDDLAIHVLVDYDVPQPGFIYFGSPAGFNTEPDQVIDNLPARLATELSGVGDVNGDGFNDVALGDYLLYLGSETGLRADPISLHAGNNTDFWNTTPYIDSDDYNKGFPAGDVNGDGIDDMIFLMYNNNGCYILHGSKNGFSSTPDWISLKDPIKFVGTDFEAGSAGDINGDGYDDVYINSSATFAYVYLGSANGLETNPHWISLPTLNLNYSENLRNITSGDFDGDGFSDLIVSEKYYNARYFGSYTMSIRLLRGSENGLDSVNTVLLKEEFVLDESISDFDPVPVRSLHDLNEDGWDDYSVGNQIWFTYDADDFYKPNKAFESWPEIRTAGDINGDQIPDLYYYDGENLNINYYRKPAITFTDSIRLCRDPALQYHHVSTPVTSVGEIDFISIRQEGAVNYSGFAQNFDQYLPAGRTKTHWEVTFIGKKQISFTTVVDIVTTPFTSVTIKPNSAHPKGDPNTFYIGYGETAFRLAALPAGGGGPYTYLWSNGSTEKNPRISESVPGEYPYWVKMTNVHGCESSDTAIIKVENALCSSPLVDVVMSQYPAILQNPLLANLIKSNSKIAVCKDGQTMCFTKAVVDVRITRAGYTIGACTPGVIPAEAFMTDEMEDILRGGLKVIVAPNPSSHAFQLNVVSIYNEPVMIRIMDLAGRQVEVLNNASSNQTLTIGHKLRAGTYIAEGISGKEREVVKLVKMQ